ncbi:M20 family metallo-hydrolase [Candidatus Methanomassiliicoccus intestinalis]|uniref:M20 family metallo-hydrolase n=1 Tax=Candidatus Methanomassiliicoccus intestinalis TaxID=1406512 RepID=UPI0037DDC33A
MQSKKELIETAQNCQKQMVDELTAMLRIPAMGPENGGDGEGRRADHLENLLKSWNLPVERIEIEDERLGTRPNLLSRIKGKEERTIWLVAHMDTVSPGNLNSWDSDPFEPVVKDGKVYGRGSEDNGQSVISSIFALKILSELEEAPEQSYGVVLVADEEAGSLYGIRPLIEQGCFRKEDVFFVPDFGEATGSSIEIMEKSIIWLKASVKGKQVHASVPNRGTNALVEGSKFILALRDALYAHFNLSNSAYNYEISTFEPTKRENEEGSINIIPEVENVFFDIRLLPEYSIEECVSFAEEFAAEYSKKNNINAAVENVRVDPAGPPSTTESREFSVLKDSIREVINVDAKAIGIGGQTCANWFRKAGYSAYAWQTVEGLAHQTNEYSKIENIVNDSAVFVLTIYELCFRAA